MPKQINEEAVESIIRTEHHDPFSILGMHPFSNKGKKGLAARAFLPDALSVCLVDFKNGERFPMRKIHDAGFFEGLLDKRSEVFPYRLAAIYPDGSEAEFHDSYSFRPSIGEMDQYLFNEGNHHKIYEKLGAHYFVMEYFDQKIGGISFGVWAPNAKRVSVVGDFNNWDGRRHVMRSLGCSGIWELFVPGLQTGQNYKFEIKSQRNELLEKADPFAFYAEIRPKTASKIYDLSGYNWQDNDWMKNRPTRTWHREPMSVFECHLGSFERVTEEGNRFLTYQELAPKICDHVKKMGYTHIELMPVTEHPLDMSWGYQVTGFFAPTSRFGSPKDFMFFVDYMHQNGIGVILDWVPAHFPKDGHGLARFDGTALYEHSDPRQGEHRDWATLIFNYGRNEVKNFLISSALFWLEKYHIDGFRVDAVASMLYLDYSRSAGEWVPNRFGGRENLEAIEFIKYFNSITHEKFPGIITVAEESTAFPAVSKPCSSGGLGFGFKWNMGWMNDTLSYFQKDSIYRRYHHGLLTFPLIYAFHENFIMVMSHDEVVHGKGSLIGKMPGDYWQKFANLRLLFGMMWGMPGKKLLFMGCDIGQWTEWNSNQSLDWHLLEFDSHAGVNKLVADLNSLYKSEPSMYQKEYGNAGFEWIDFEDADSCVISWIRRGDDPNDYLVFVANYTPVPRLNYRIGVPEGVFYKEVMNTNSKMYYGSNMGNNGGVSAQQQSWHYRPWSILIDAPPLSVSIFKPTRW